MIDGSAAVQVELRLRFSHATGDTELETADEDEEVVESADDALVREHRAIYDSFDRRMRRFAELVKRETGVHSLWLGYPLLHSADHATDPARQTQRGAKKPRPAGTMKITTNTMMIETVDNIPAAYGWTVSQWAKHLDRGKSTIQTTKMWKLLHEQHQRAPASKVLTVATASP